MRLTNDPQVIPCFDCGGEGRIPVTYGAGGKVTEWAQCARCEGTGFIPMPEVPE